MASSLTARLLEHESGCISVGLESVAIDHRVEDRRKEFARIDDPHHRPWTLAGDDQPVVAQIETDLEMITGLWKGQHQRGALFDGDLQVLDLVDAERVGSDARNVQAQEMKELRSGWYRHGDVVAFVW